MDASVMAILAWLNLLFKQAKQNQLFMIRHKPWLPHICCQWLETGFLLTAWFGFSFLHPFHNEKFKTRYVRIFPPIFLSFFSFSFSSCCDVSGLFEKICGFNVKYLTSFFYLSFTRLAGFASFNVKMSVQESFCGRNLIHELTWF